MATRKLPEFLKWLRRRSELSIREAAERSELNRGTISQLENGKRPATPDYLAALAAAYQVDRHYVLLYAGIIELPGFEILMEETEESCALDRLLAQANLDEKRQLAKHLASLRMTSPLMDELYARA